MLAPSEIELVTARAGLEADARTEAAAKAAPTFAVLIRPRSALEAGVGAPRVDWLLEGGTEVFLPRVSLVDSATEMVEDEEDGSGLTSRAFLAAAGARVAGSGSLLMLIVSLTLFIHV